MSRPRGREAIIDANIVIRILTERSSDLAERADRLLKAGEARGLVMVLTPVSLAEIVYVLGSVYRWSKREIADRLLEEIETGVLAVLERDLVMRALEWYRDLPQIHFADAYIAAYAMLRSNGVVASFDRELRRVPGLTVLADASDLSA